MVFVDRGTVKVDETLEINTDDHVIIIEAFDEAERRRVHELMTENWELLSLVRRRTEDGDHYTEYVLRAPAEFALSTGPSQAPGAPTTPPVVGRGR